MEVIRSNTALVAEAKEAETAGDMERAASLYEQVIKNDPIHQAAYDRLMIIYRKQKLYRKEWQVINKGIKAFEALHKPAAKGAKGKRIQEISEKLLKFTGLADKKGNHLYDPEPIGRWKKRRTVVEKRGQPSKR